MRCGPIAVGGMTCPRNRSAKRAAPASSACAIQPVPISIASASSPCKSRSSVPPTICRVQEPSQLQWSWHPVVPRRSPRLAILLEPLADDAIGRGIVAGVTPVRIDVVRETDLYAGAHRGHDHALAEYSQRPDAHPVEGSGHGCEVGGRATERTRTLRGLSACGHLAGCRVAGTRWLDEDDRLPARVLLRQAATRMRPTRSDATETIWHQAGYPPAQRSAVVALHKSTGRVPARFGSGDWVWCPWNEYENRWQVLGDYEDHWRFVLSSSLTRCGSASAALVLYDGTKWCPQPLVFTVVDCAGCRAG